MWRDHHIAFVTPSPISTLLLRSRTRPLKRLLSPAFYQPHPTVFVNSRTGAACIQSCLSEKEKAHIFQRSHFHDERRQFYSSTRPTAASGYTESQTTEQVDEGSYDGPAPTMDTLADTETTGAASVMDQVAAGTKSTSGLSDSAHSAQDPTQSTVRNESPSHDLYMHRVDVDPSPYHSPSFVPYGHEELIEPRFSSHNELLSALQNLTDDPLERDGGRIVTYRGSPEARVMIIGEAPGEQEDLEGKPFVGRAGQLLDKIFAYGGFNVEEQLYVTNVAKRRPEKNRTPTPEEAAFYKPYLMEEIRLIQPAVIVLAGAVAMKVFSKHKMSITKCRGQWFSVADFSLRIMPVFHPAYLLRKPVAKYDMVQDIEEIRRLYMHVMPNDTLSALKKVS